MPFPLVALVPGLIAWGSRALATYGLAKLFSDNSIGELYDMLLNWVVVEVADKTGLQLDPDQPFSDASMAGAVGQKLGFPIRSIRDPVLIREDLDAWAAGQVSQRSGYLITSVSNIDVLKADLERIAMAIITERVGIPLGGVNGLFDPETAREQVILWAKAYLLANMGDEVGFVVDEIISAGGLDAVASDLNSRLSTIGSIENVTARQLAMKIAEKMAASAITEFGKVASGMDKKNRQRELNRWYQAKFRRRHGNRERYIPLGFTVSYVPGVLPGDGTETG